MQHQSKSHRTMHTRAPARPVRQAMLARQAKLGREQGFLREVKRLEVLLQESEQRRGEDARQIEALLRLNRDLARAGAGAADERALMESALSTLSSLVGALGCSFVPVDEWQQPLPPFTYGRLPEPVLRAWAAHLADGYLRQRCASCQAHESLSGGCPLHPEQVGETLTVQCLPLHDLKPAQPGLKETASSAPILGMLHLYLPAGRRLDARTREFIDLLLPEIALAYQGAHLRAQEESTLRQIQLLHNTESDLMGSLRGLLDGLRQAFEISVVLVRLYPGADEQPAEITIQSGELAEQENLLRQAVEQVARGRDASSPAGGLPVWLAVPVAIPGRPALGVLLAASEEPYEFHPRQEIILHTVASQAALLVENERMIRSLEYNAVIQERTRLAREIHDGLAQTIAFLKLRAGQMQSYLAQGNLPRLTQALQENAQILNEAYLDTRQSIDNLRMTPPGNLSGWLERTISEFASSSGLLAEAHIEQHASERAASIPLEIQAQIMRIIQEALTNVRKHARAGRASVMLRERLGSLVIEVLDDGSGFEAGDVPEISRHGLRGMRERAELIGADFQITSQEGKGTTVSLVLPGFLEEKTAL